MGFAVLVVDADLAGNKLVRIILEAEGWTVVAVETISEARAALGTFAPDVIATELRLPDGDGLSFVAALAKDPATRHIALVAVTAVNGSDTRAAAARAGCVAYLKKPIDVETFAAQLRALMRDSP